MKNTIESEYGLQIDSIKLLNGYDNANYLITTKTDKFIFKTYTLSEDTYDTVQAENEILLALQPSNAFPRPISFSDGVFIKQLIIDGKPLICRMLSFLEGVFLADVIPSEVLYESLGVFLANMDIKLKSISNYVIKSREWEWDLQYLDLNKKFIQAIPNESDRRIVQYFFQQYSEIVKPLASDLRKQIIHNDPNEWNILTNEDQVSGIIDYGDLAHSFLINEVAIAITYACYKLNDPLKWASIILKAYHSITPIKAIEVKVLYYLIAARLVTSVCNSAQSKKDNPDNSYASVSEVSAWKMLRHWLTINPIAAENKFRLTIGLPIEPPNTLDNIISNRHRYISKILSLSYDKPIYMTRSVFQYMYDAYGNTYLDAYNNIPHVGHAHPKVVSAGQKQMARLNTNTRYLYDELAEYAEKLLAYFPDNLSKVFFVNSGSAASDLAIRMAKKHTKHQHLIVMEHGYHGNTQTSIDISDYKFNHTKGDGQKGHIIKTTIPDTYKGTYRNNDGSAGNMYAQEAIAQIENSKAPIAAFITEPVVGCGGQVPLAKGYLKAVYPAIRKQGGVCISDEVQTGFGRLGDYFWGFEAQEVIPDIVVLGKPMANGHPMGAVVCTEEIEQSFKEGVEFFSSFGGNPVSCAIASSVLDVIESEALQNHAKQVGDYYKTLFLKLQKIYPCIGDVRGSGLFIGVEIIANTKLDPDTQLAKHIKNRLRDNHILVSTDGPDDNVIKSKPPLCFTKENAKLVVDTIEMILKAYYK